MADNAKLSGDYRLLNLLAQAGLSPLHNGDIAAALGISTSTASEAVRRAVAAGWAREFQGGWVIGPMVELAVRRINEDKAAAAETLSQMMANTDVQPSPGGPDGEQLLGLRLLGDLLKTNKSIEQKLTALTREREAAGLKKEIA